MSPRVDGGRNIGLLTCSAQSRWGGINTAGTVATTGAGVAAVDEIGRGRGTRGQVLTLREDNREPPSGPNLQPTAKGHYRLLSLFVGASSMTEGLERQSRKGRTQSNGCWRRSPPPG